MSLLFHFPMYRYRRAFPNKPHISAALHTLLFLIVVHRAAHRTSPHFITPFYTIINGQRRRRSAASLQLDFVFHAVHRDRLIPEYVHCTALGAQSSRIDGTDERKSLLHISAHRLNLRRASHSLRHQTFLPFNCLTSLNPTSQSIETLKRTAISYRRQLTGL